MIYTLIVAANLILGGRFASILIKKYKEEGYVFPFKDKTTKEKILELAPFILAAFIPILNIATLVAEIGSLTKEEFREKAYDAFREGFIKTGIMMEPVDGEVTNTVKVNKPYDVENKEEEVIRTHHDAASLWLQQHEEELREERSKHVCPTLDLGGSNNEEDLNQGYQKTMKR